MLERSRETSGLPFVFLLKTLIPLFAALLGLQGMAQAIRAAHVLDVSRLGPYGHPSSQPDGVTCCSPKRSPS